jgi:hypothetical protein
MTGSVIYKDATLSGSLSSIENTMSGTLTPTGAGSIENPYTGSYEVTPDVFNPQILKTKNCILTDDIVINEVPYFETSNDQNGITIYIGGN